MLGQEVYSVCEQFYAGQHRFTVTPEQIGSGVYFLEVEAGDQHQAQRVLYLK
ncbi:hypothetical protein K8I28_13450 [bacterium]|nr:hypothetical protein [bacterium]